MPSYCLLIAGASINHFIYIYVSFSRATSDTTGLRASCQDAKNTQRIKSRALTSESDSVRVRLPFLRIKANVSEAQTNSSSRERRSSLLIFAFQRRPGINLRELEILPGYRQPFVLFSANL